MPAGVVADWRYLRPSTQLAPLISSVVGYRYEGFEPGFHRGLPSCSLTVVISLGEPTNLSAMPDPSQRPDSFVTLASGLHTRPAMIAHDGNQYGMQLSLTPAGARALLGLPPGALGPTVVELSELMGRAAVEMVERTQAACDWDQRFAILTEVLSRRLGGRAPASAQLCYAWERITGSGGQVRIADVAADIGWSRRHLAKRFQVEFGVTPKEVGRLARFERSQRVLRRLRFSSLADVAAECGYYDQAHMAREWNDLAGCPPSEWLSTEKLPFVQDPPADCETDWGHDTH